MTSSPLLIPLAHGVPPVEVAVLELQDAEGDLCTGLVRCMHDGPLREALGRLEELTAQQILSLIDEAMAGIAILGPCIRWRGAWIAVRDLQVHDGGVSFRCDPEITRELAKASSSQAAGGAP